MPTPTPHEITVLLLAWNHGDQAALDQLLPLVYGELHRLARHYMHNERPGHLLQTTALVNEAYLRLVDTRQIEWQNRAHFFAIAARLMRRILVDFAREQNYQKRGGGEVQIPLDEAPAIACEWNEDVVALDEALAKLAAIDERKSRVVELRFFGGLTEDETATVLQVSHESVKRDWRLAKSWLLRQLRAEVAHAA
ncbi:MAG: sigma-70 family RNA polymerase sigma factor [Acidobacteria bacterium]|nr:sigma-70 family RNA polymerase sigma factor [Acidobacteriota bacterium]